MSAIQNEPEIYIAYFSSLLDTLDLLNQGKGPLLMGPL